MIVRHLPLAFVVVLGAACGRSDEKSDASMIKIGAARSDSMPLREGDVRIVTNDGSVDLALQGDSISSGLSQSALRKAREETDAAKVQGSGLGASIERMVKSSVQDAIGTRIAFSVNDINGARYQNGRIEFDWTGKPRQIFGGTKINGKPLLESFPPADAERFVRAVNARRTVAR
jgi:hypothetical protein